MIINQLLIAIELWVFGGVLLLLHRLRTQYGLVPFLFLLSGYTTILQFTAPLGVFVRPTENLILVIGSNVLVPVILMGILVTYVIEGTIPARGVILGIVIVSGFSLFILFSLNTHIALPQGGNFAGLPPGSPVLVANPRTIVASILTFALDLFIIVIVYQTIKNRWPSLPIWIAPGIALLASLWGDTLVFQVVGSSSSQELTMQLPGQLVGKTVSALLLWPLVAHYLTREMPSPQRSPELRPTFDLLFGSLGKLETVLSQTQAHLRRRADEQRALEATLLDITASEDLNEFLNLLVARAVRLLDGTDGGLYLSEPQKQQVLCVVSYNTPKDYTGIRLAYGEGAAGTVAQSGKAMIIKDYRSWPGRAPFFEEDQPFRSVLSAPLVWNKEVLGVIHVVNSQTPDQFNDADLDLLMAFGNHATIAVNNARMLQEAQARAAESERLRQAGVVVAATLEQEEAIERILVQLENVIPFDSACVMLLSEKDHLEIVGGRGWPDPGDVLGLTFPIPGDNPNTEVIQSQRVVVLQDAPKTYEGFRREPHMHIRSWLGVPLIFRNQVIGMLAVDHTQPNFFSEDHVRLASAFANQVAIAIGHAGLYAQENQRVQELNALRSTLADLSTTLDLSTLLETILKQAVKLVGATGGDLSLYDGKQKTLQIVVSHNLGKDYTGTYMDIGEGAMGQAVAQKEALIIEDYSQWDGQSPQYSEGSWHSVMAAPLLWEDERVGAIGVVDADATRYFSESDKQLLLMLANQAAIAIQNARLFEEAQAQAMTDSLTGLYNRRAFDQALKRECVRALRGTMPLSLAILDIDDFKVFNDTYGHPAGDEQLKMLAELLIRNVRSSDLVARYGGEEFAIILPQCTQTDALSLLYRIRVAAEATYPDAALDGKPIPGHTLSIGVASLPDDAYTAKHLLIAADGAELAAKREGKNRVVAARRDPSG